GGLNNMESNYQVAYKHEWSKLKNLDLLDICKRLNVEYNNEKNIIIIPFFNEYYILDMKNETIYKNKDNTFPPIDDSIIILNYLTYSVDYVLNSYHYVTLKELPNGGALFYPAFSKLALKKLIDTFGYDITRFEKICLQLKGNPINLGDKGFEFNVLPKVNLHIAIWEGDDEVSPNATILYNTSVQYLIHIETIIGIGISLANKLTSL
ncbi:MAG: DUF3786 domain-containing protein, partial [Peptostreptococcaceae bacterium]